MILVTNADSFIGKNLVCFLEQMHYAVAPLQKHCSSEQFINALKHTDFIINLLNIDFIATLLGMMHDYDVRSPLLTISDATHRNNKWDRECEVLTYAKRHHTKAFIARLPVVFGKWGERQELDTSNHAITLMHIDDVISIFMHTIQNASSRDSGYLVLKPVYNTTTDNLRKIYQLFSKDTKTIPHLDDAFSYKLYATYLSYLTPDDTLMTSDTQMNVPHFGHFSLVTLKPKETYGHHWHHTKFEKYTILSGCASLSLRSVLEDTLYFYQLSAMMSLIIPPTYTYQLTNHGDTELLLLLWSSDDTNTDTFLEYV